MRDLQRMDGEDVMPPEAELMCRQWVEDDTIPDLRRTPTPDSPMGG